MTRKPDDRQALHLFIPPEWHEALRQRAFQERKSIAALVRQALRTEFGFTGGEPEDDAGRKGGEYGRASSSPTSQAMSLCDR